MSSFKPSVIVNYGTRGTRSIRLKVSAENTWIFNSMTCPKTFKMLKTRFNCQEIILALLRSVKQAVPVNTYLILQSRFMIIIRQLTLRFMIIMNLTCNWPQPESANTNLSTPVTINLNVTHQIILSANHPQQPFPSSYAIISSKQKTIACWSLKFMIIMNLR